MKCKTLSQEIEALEAFIECQSIYIEMCLKRKECAIKYNNFLKKLLEDKKVKTRLDGQG